MTVNPRIAVPPHSAGSHTGVTTGTGTTGGTCANATGGMCPHGVLHDDLLPLKETWVHARNRSSSHHRLGSLSRRTPPGNSIGKSPTRGRGQVPRP